MDRRFLAAIDSSARNSGRFLLLPGYTTGIGESFARASSAYQQGNNGLYTSVASDIKRLYHYIGGYRTILREGAATNVVLWNRDLTNVAWVATTMTAAKDQVGIDGVSNSASSITATGNDATILQTITLASSARFQSAFVRRITGTGAVSMTMDNGATWTAVTVTDAWTRVSIATQTLANPVVGFKLATNGDAIAVDVVQNEGGTAMSSPVVTTNAAVTRAADLWSFAWPRGPEAGTFLFDFYDLMGAATGLAPAGFYLGDNSATVPYHRTYKGSGKWTAYNNTAAGTSTSVAAAGASYGDRVELRSFNVVTGVDATANLGQSINGAAEAVAAAGTARALDAAYSAPTRLHIGSINTSAPANLALRSLAYVPGPAMSMAAMRVIVGS